jgi:formylglycine-generating enzyme required for sulfatase activity
MTWIPGGTFTMGSDLAGYPEEHPPRPVTVDGFFMDLTPVTVAAYAAFTAATGYRTVAERPLDPACYPALPASALVPGSMVFQPTGGPADLTDWRSWWRYVPGADWAHPHGPARGGGGEAAGGVDGRGDHPVVHVCWEDVAAYAAWAGKDLPTEAEWERAARGGLDGARYAWGDEFAPAGRLMANTWIGEFPWQNLKPPQIRRTTPVGAFPANGFGLADITGNVWEWTRDFYQARGAAAGTAGTGAQAGQPCCGGVTRPLASPRVDDPAGSFGPDEPGGARVPRRVVKGGSHLCAPNYCERYRPAARQAQPVESSMSHLGFRCVIRP